MVMDRSLKRLPLHEFDIKDNYSFINNKVDEFLMDKSYLLPILVEANQQIKSIFTDVSRLSLAVEADPELYDSITLLLSIHVGSEADFEKVDGLLSKLDDTWWIDVSSSAPDLDIDVKFD